MINFSLMGAGRIGKMHAKFIAAHPNANLKYIYDVNSQFAEEVAKSTGCSIASSPEEAIEHPVDFATSSANSELMS